MKAAFFCVWGFRWLTYTCNTIGITPMMKAFYIAPETEEVMVSPSQAMLQGSPLGNLDEMPVNPIFDEVF